MSDTNRKWSREERPLRIADRVPVVERRSPASIVPEAAAILREEMESFTEGASRLSSALGSEIPLMQAPPGELREQARSLIDTVLGLLGQRPDVLAQLLKQVSVGARAEDGGGSREGVPLLRAARPVTAGDVAHLSLRLRNDDTEHDECTLCVTDLIGASGNRIPASHVRVSPQPARIPGGGSADVQIEIRVPSRTPAGCYTGLVQTDDGEALRALVQLTVTQ